MLKDKTPYLKLLLRGSQDVLAAGLFLISLSTLCLSTTTQSSAAGPTDSEHETEALATSAVTILRNQCFSCHGADKNEGGLRVDSRESVLQGGTLGPAFELNTPTRSLLLQVVRSEIEGMEMPPKKPLSKKEIDILEAWLSKGMPWPAAITSTNSSMTNSISPDSAWVDPNNPARTRWQGERLDHWSLRPIAANPTPTFSEEISHLSHPAHNPIDRFVDAYRHIHKLPTSAPAERRVLIRRLSMDLTGLPPTTEQVASFVHAEDADFYDREVERLLASPAYGEHLGRVWLDVVRYSDSNGFDWDEFRPKAWKYRDYVIEVLNEDLPYDQFIVEQLAGDELVSIPAKTPSDLRTLLATGFLRMGPYDNAAPLFNEQDRSRAEFLADITETTGSAFLGQTLSCCRCHDHKTDPWLHSDYFRFRAFFAAVEFGDNLPLELASQLAEIEKNNADIDQQIMKIEQLLKDAETSPETEKKNYQEQLTSLKAQRRAFDTGLIVKENPASIPPTYVLFQGDHRTPRDEVQPGIPAMYQPTNYTTVATTHSSGRRLALARWIASEQNPWTARVIVNRLWQLHFGEGIVRTPNDFGISGDPPQSLALLDWLASELIRNDWSLKHIQRLIVTSRTYQEQTLKDHWPRQIKRLSAEQLRDAMLSVSGLLQRRRGGPPVWPPVPEEVLQANPATLDDNETRTKGWYPSAADDQSVRSIYLVQKRTIRIPFMETFDLPDNSVSCGCRNISIVAPQALSLLNGDWAVEAAKALSQRISSANSADRKQQVELVFLSIFQRYPNDSERLACIQFIEERSLTELTRALLNSNEFLFLE